MEVGFLFLKQLSTSFPEKILPENLRKPDNKQYRITSFTVMPFISPHRLTKYFSCLLGSLLLKYIFKVNYFLTFRVTAVALIIKSFTDTLMSSAKGNRRIFKKG